MNRIVLVTYGLNQGGTDRVAAQMACGFANAGYRVTLVCCTSAGVVDEYMCGQMSPAVERVALSTTSWKSRARGKLMTLFAWRRWLSNNRDVTVIATGNNIARFTGLGVAMTGFRRPPLYIKVTNPIVREGESRFKAFIRYISYGLLFRYADGVFALSDAQTRLLERQFPRAASRFQTVYNAYLTPDFEASSLLSADETPVQTITIIAVGRLAAQKNFGRLLRAYALALQDIPVEVETRLQIAGDGPDRASLESLTGQLGISDKVEFLGYRRDIAMLMAQSQLFVLSSDYEGLPAVVIEALASDCPVVATDCFPNARDLLAGLPGCAVTPRDDERLGKAIAQAICAQYQAPDARSALRPYALRYSTASAVQSHLRAMQVSSRHVVNTPAAASR